MKISPVWIMIIYVMVCCVACILGINSEMDVASINITIGMLTIVGIIFVYSTIKAIRAFKIGKDLRRAANLIVEDSKNQDELLWDVYKKNEEMTLFQTEELIKVFRDYKNEMLRLEKKTNATYKCDIDDYFNSSLIDSAFSKSIINLIPGTMTGLGILGTFIGLAISLKNFEMGEVDQILSSIPKLMTGLKVAFQTSIYGMILSLAFNFVYRKLLTQVYEDLNIFISAYEKYVASDADADNKSQIQLIIQQIPECVGEKIADVLSPSLEKMNSTLDRLASDLNQKQIEGVSTLVDQIMESLNTLLGENFKHLGETIEQTCEIQRENGIFMQDILARIGDMTQNIKEINDLSAKTIESMSIYIDRIENLQEVINDNFMSASIQLEENKEYEIKMKEYIDILVSYEKQIGEAAVKFSDDMAEQVKMLEKMESDIAGETRKNLEIMAQNAKDYNEMLSEAAKQQISIILNMAADYSEKIVTHLNYADDVNHKISENAQESIKTLSENASNYHKTLADSAKNQIESIINLSNTQTADMKSASQELARVSENLNGQLVESLNKTFDVFDEQLTSITEHLSGTISQINDATGRVPKTVVAAYDGMKNGFEEMKTRYIALVDSMEDMNNHFRSISEQLKNINTYSE